MPVLLTLGPLLFSDFEVPDSSNFGGEQMLVVRKLVGGDRVIDAMGRDDDDIRWSGRFRGDQAETRAALADSLRVDGQPITSAWSSRRYLVVVRDFKAQFQQPFEIPYSIVCTVLQDLSVPIASLAGDINAAINSDVTGAGVLGTGLSMADVSAGLAGVSAAVGIVNNFPGAPVSQLIQVQTALSVAQSAVTGRLNSLNGVVANAGSVAGVVGGLGPQSIAASLSGQATAFQQLGQLYQIQALLGRTSVNVANAGS